MDNLDNGFYWVICEEVDDQPLVAECCDGEWFLPGFGEPYTNDQVMVVSERIEKPPLS